jgi:sugar phosphate isomerase/epimerase
VDGLGVCCAEAETRGLTVGLEFHGGTPTATVAGTLGLIEAVGSPNLFTYWQPPYWHGPTTPESDAAEAIALLGVLSHLHVYEWASPEDRRALVEGTDRWRAVLGAVDAGTPETGTPETAAWRGDRVAFLEFVAGDDPEALRRDAATLRDWLVDDIPGHNIEARRP